MKTDWVNIWGLFEKFTIIASSQLAKLKRSHFLIAWWKSIKVF